MTDHDLKQAILSLLRSRRAGATICPSEVARAAGQDDWRGLIPAVREAAAALASEGLIEITQNGEVVSPGPPPDGPVRLRLLSPHLTGGS
jgi:hypothetical protein